MLCRCVGDELPKDGFAPMLGHAGVALASSLGGADQRAGGKGVDRHERWDGTSFLRNQDSFVCAQAQMIQQHNN